MFSVSVRPQRGFFLCIGMRIRGNCGSAEPDGSPSWTYPHPLIALNEDGSLDHSEVVERTMWLAANAPMRQVRAISSAELSRTRDDLRDRSPSEPNAQLLARDIQRFLDRPGEAVPYRSAPPVPPGSPIGEPAMDWLGRLELWCSWLEEG